VSTTTHNTKEAQEETRRVAPRLPESLWRRVRVLAVHEATTAEAIVIDALEAHLPKLEKKAGIGA